MIVLDAEDKKPYIHLCMGIIDEYAAFKFARIMRQSTCLHAALPLLGTIGAQPGTKRSADISFLPDSGC